MKKETYLKNFPCLVKVDAEKVISTLSSMTYKGEKALDFYRRKTSSRKVAIKCGPYVLYVGDPLSKGNKKIDTSCLISKLLPIATCPNCKSCKDKCYALKAVYAYPSNFFKELIYTYLATVNPMEYVNLIAAQVEKSKKEIKYIRIHEAGDFFSIAYVESMKELFHRFPSIQFFTYTKTKYDLSECKNFNIVESMINFHGKNIVNFAPVEKLEKIASELNYPICPCGHIEEKHRCMKDCTLCARCKNVLFVEH